MTFNEACWNINERDICHGDCCGSVPVPQELWAKYKDSVTVEYTLYTFGPLVYPLTEDLRCVFLNKVKSICTVYDERPSICFRFGSTDDEDFLQCPYLFPDGTIRTRVQRRRVQRKVGNRAEKIGLDFMKMRKDDKNTLDI